MAECEFLAGCPFFNDQMQGMPATAEIYKNKYCRGDKHACARFVVKTQGGGVPVPADLYPNQAERAAGLISRRPS